MIRAPTLSTLGHLAACPGSASLPWLREEGARAPTLGHAIHELIAHIVASGGATHGERASFAHLWADILPPDDEGRLAFLAEHLSLPVPAGALAEVALGYFPDGSVRRVEGGSGVYPDVGALLSGTIDCMWAEPRGLQDVCGPAVSCGGYADCPPGSTLWVVDWKTGDEDHVPPVDRNWQLRGAALMAARWTGAQRVISAICYVNAGECAEAVRAGRPYEGRWEVGALLDASALDKIEDEVRAVLARARGEDDAVDPGRVLVLRDDRPLRGVDTEHERPANLSRVRSGSDAGAAALILGPHCEHCPARGACPAFAADALSLARAEGIYLPPGGALTTEAASHLAGLLAPARLALDAVELAVQAHVRVHGPLLLADGREYGPVVEAVTSYRTRATFDALEAVVGEEAANEAATYTGASLKRALEGQPRGAWGRLKTTLEERGAVVVTAREVWRRKYPAKPVEVEDGDRSAEPARDAHGERHEGGAPGGIGEASEAEASRQGGHPPDGVTHAAEAAEHLGLAVPRGTARAPCPACGVSYSLTTAGLLRKHHALGTALRCAGSGKPPAQLTLTAGAG